MAIIYWATLRINIEQTLGWITGLHLESISQFEKGFRSQDRNLLQAFIDWGRVRKNSERVKRPGELLLIDWKKLHENKLEACCRSRNE